MPGLVPDAEPCAPGPHPADSDGLRAALAEAHRRCSRRIDHRRMAGPAISRQGAVRQLSDGRQASAHRDPLRRAEPGQAALVRGPRRWRWSSARAHVAGSADGLTDLAGHAGPAPQLAGDAAPRPRGRGDGAGGSGRDRGADQDRPAARRRGLCRGRSSNQRAERSSREARAESGVEFSIVSPK